MAADSKKIVLIVDDDRVDRKDAKIALGDEFQILEAGAAAEALAIAQTHKLDCAILDYYIPGADTWGLLAELKQKGVSVVLLTGKGNRELADAAMAQGVEDYIVKGNYDEDQLARSVRFALERRQRQQAERELHAAFKVQQTLYPKAAPDVPGLDVSGSVQPASQACGDYYDYFPIGGDLGNNDKLALVIGDVSGHGMAAALVMVEARAYLRVLSQTLSDPGEILTRINELLGDRLDYFITLFYGCLDLTTQTFEFSSGGHPGFVVRADGEVDMLQPTGIPVGIVPGSQFPCAEKVPLCQGDILLLTTDGVEESESPDGKYFGAKRMLQTVIDNRHRTAHEIKQAIFDEVTAFTGGAPGLDDVTILVAKVDCR